MDRYGPSLIHFLGFLLVNKRFLFPLEHHSLHIVRRWLGVVVQGFAEERQGIIHVLCKRETLLSRVEWCLANLLGGNERSGSGSWVSRYSKMLSPQLPW